MQPTGNLRWIFCTAVAALAFAMTAASAEETIKIGIPIGLSGANSVVAPSVVQAAQLAAAEINARLAAFSAKRSNWRSPMTAAVPMARSRRIIHSSSSRR